MIIYSGQTTFVNLMGLIKESNPDFVIPRQDQVIVGVPEASNAVAGRDTVVALTGVLNNGYKNTVELYYKRCSLQEYITAGWLASVFEMTADLTTPALAASHLLAAFVRMRSEIILNEGNPLELPALGRSMRYTMRPIANSLVFAPSSQVEVTLNNNRQVPFIRYPFNDRASQASIKNRNGVDGTCTLRAGPQIGPIGNGWNFGNGIYINTNQKTPRGALTFSAYFIPGQLTGNHAFFGDGGMTDGANTRVYFGYKDDSFVVKIGDGTTLWTMTEVVAHEFELLKRYHVCFTLAENGRSFKIYVNGAMRYSDMSPIARQATESPNNLSIGSSGRIGTDMLLAVSLSEAAFWNIELPWYEIPLLANLKPKYDSRFKDVGPNAVLNVGVDAGRAATCMQMSSARGATPASSGKRMFEYTDTITAGYCLLGVGSADARLDAYPGSSVVTPKNVESWSYFARNGAKYHPSVNSGADNTGPAYGAAWTSHDVIGVVVDFDARTLSFYKNGVSQGVAFTGLVNKPLYPMIGSGSSDSQPVGGILNIGENGFAYPIDGVLPWAG